MKTKIITIIVAFIGIIIISQLVTARRISRTTLTPYTPSNSVCTSDQNGCVKQSQKNTSVASLTSNELASMLKKKDFFFANVHVPYEGEIKNTDSFIPYDKITDNLDKLPKNKNAKIVLYCRSGRMSEIAAEELSRLGYTQVYQLSGGMLDWEKNGYEIIKKTQ